MIVIVEVYASENFLTENTEMLSPAIRKYRNDEHSVMFTSVLKDSDSSILRVTGFVNSVHRGILNRICLGNWNFFTCSLVKMAGKLPLGSTHQKK